MWGRIEKGTHDMMQDGGRPLRQFRFGGAQRSEFVKLSSEIVPSWESVELSTEVAPGVRICKRVDADGSGCENLQNCRRRWLQV